LDLLDELLTLIETDIGSRAQAKNVIVFLGDLIDRGPCSAQVVERLRVYKPPFARTVFLMGNHEEVLLRIVDGETRLIGDWLRFGGAECLTSYGLKPSEVLRTEPSQRPRLIRQHIPGSHLEFLEGFGAKFVFGSYLFVHAGIRPGVPLVRQRIADLRWIREPFLEDASDHRYVVVHGHTITEKVEVRENRIGIDTGAYHSGVLTALALEGSDRWFLQARSVSP
jgi:serine/threonine protein phosphatase 1